MKKRDQFLGLNSIKFALWFYQDEVFYKYIEVIKWEDGYTCRKCGSNDFYRGLKPHSISCLKFKYDESQISGNMFDRSKIPIHIASHTTFWLCTKKKGMSF